MKDIDYETAVKLADNAFDCASKFTYRVASRFNNYFTVVFIWLILLTLVVISN